MQRRNVFRSKVFLNKKYVWLKLIFNLFYHRNPIAKEIIENISIIELFCGEFQKRNLNSRIRKYKDELCFFFSFCIKNIEVV